MHVNTKRIRPGLKNTHKSSVSIQTFLVLHTHERERERERERDRQTERQRDRETERDRERQRQRQTDRQTETDRQTDRQFKRLCVWILNSPQWHKRCNSAKRDCKTVLPVVMLSSQRDFLHSPKERPAAMGVRCRDAPAWSWVRLFFPK